MSENSLKIRSKFINKISNKLSKLNEDLELLAKVDRKIFRNKRIQSGGADPVIINDVQKVAIKKLLEIRQAQAQIDEVTKKATNLTDQITQINDALTSIRTTVDKIGITVPVGLSNAVFNVNSLSKDVVELLIGDKGSKVIWKDIEVLQNPGLNEETFNKLKEELWPPALGATTPALGATTPAEGAVLPEAKAEEEKFDAAGNRKYRFW